MPTDTKMSFSAHQKQLEVPLVIYADSESVIEAGTGVHKVASFGYFIESKIPSIPSSTSPVIYRGENVIDNFLNEMEKLSKLLTNIIDEEAKPMNLTPADLEKIKHQTICHICQKKLGTGFVRDHDHITGLFRSLAHASCNLKYRPRKNNFSSQYFIPIFFHNLRGYDSHFIIKELKQCHKTHVIANSMEKYISFSINNLKFVDSLQFLPASLDKLSQTCKTFPRFMSKYADSNLLRKGVYPYEWFDDVSKFNETSLPPKSAFFNKLTNLDISEEDFSFAQNVWKKYNCNSFSDITIFIFL